MTGWSFQLEVFRRPPLHALLIVIEEPIELSIHHHCQHCQYIGWGHHMICKLQQKVILFVATQEHSSCLFEPRQHRFNVQVEFDNGLRLGWLPNHGILGCLCTGLGARKVSFKDISQKKGMDLRLLHAVAYSKPWFGRWDYTFGRGSFGINVEMYESTVKALQNVSLYIDFTIEVSDIIRTFFDNLRNGDPSSDSSSKESDLRWVSRQEVRDAARDYIGDTGLLDFILKSLGNHIVGKYLLRRCLNPVTKVLECCLENISREFPKQEEFLMVNNEAKLKPQQMVTWVQLMKDILYLYKNVLVEHQEMNLVFEMVRPCGKITFEGIEGQQEIVNGWIYEVLMSNVVVDCGCGTKYDDGGENGSQTVICESM
ncbi:Hypothetical predicted protein [Olea europaea subsp. europaea]|uniref:PTC1-like winged helix-turn-helix domain-containing protein n=1 Tax=Olea europaea subsp. europaea TaxID=158383 RepID=A0A8S0T867_OLEEU|nr:Hypothetical predicted protein [Olea europaea subsp. europaea]